METDQITVLLASYQGEAYLAQQLDSILRQTVPGIRIVISDDGSADGTRRILDEYRRKNPERLVLKPHVKKGMFACSSGAVPPAAMNFFWLLSQADEGYVMLSDQDDVWKAGKAETLLKRMKELERKLGEDHPILVYSDMEVTDQNLKTISSSFLSYQRSNPKRVSLSEILVENPVTGGAVMMNQALARYFRTPPEVCVMHDWWIALTAACFGTISFVPEPLYLYRQHDQNTLGARKTGSAGDLKERMGRQRQVEEAYRKMFAQAAALGRAYRKELSPEQKTVLRAFLTLPLQSPAGRLKNIVRNHFYKSSGLQTLAQCVTIPGKNQKGE